jgi:phage FluMu protein Com
MLVYGTRFIQEKGLGNFRIFCPECKRMVNAFASISTEVYHIWFIPIMPMRRELFFKCDKCKKYFSFINPKDSLEVIRKFEKLPKNITYEEYLRNSGSKGLWYSLPALITMIGFLGLLIWLILSGV